MIDFYKDIDKSHFFLGRIIQVNRDYCVVQVENNSLLSHRLLANEVLDPNSINYNVVIENEKGLFLGEVFSNNLGLNDKAKKSVFSANNDLATPCIYINLIGLKSNSDEFSGKKKVFTASTLQSGLIDKIRSFANFCLAIGWL